MSQNLLDLESYGVESVLLLKRYAIRYGTFGWVYKLARMCPGRCMQARKLSLRQGFVGR